MKEDAKEMIEEGREMIKEAKRREKGRGSSDQAGKRSITKIAG